MTRTSEFLKFGGYHSSSILRLFCGHSLSKLPPRCFTREGSAAGESAKSFQRGFSKQGAFGIRTSSRVHVRGSLGILGLTYEASLRERATFYPTLPFHKSISFGALSAQVGEIQVRSMYKNVRRCSLVP